MVSGAQLFLRVIVSRRLARRRLLPSLWPHCYPKSGHSGRQLRARGVRVALRRREVGVTGEHLHGRRRSTGAEEARHEEVPKVVKAPPLEPGALARALEALEEAPLAPQELAKKNRRERDQEGPNRP